MCTEDPSSATAPSRFDEAYSLWLQFLQAWAADGSLRQAATPAMGDLAGVEALVIALGEGDFSSIPKVEMLEAAAMGDAQAYYARATMTTAAA